MEPFDLATVDRLLTTTRAVRKRLNLTRPVPPDVIEEWIGLALQAPNASNEQAWHWIIVRDESKRAALGDLYRRSLASYLRRQVPRDGSSGLQHRHRYRRRQRRELLRHAPRGIARRRLYKVSRQDAKQFSAERCLEMITLGGAQGLLAEAEIGSLQVAKKADLVIHETDRQR